MGELCADRALTTLNRQSPTLRDRAGTPVGIAKGPSGPKSVDRVRLKKKNLRLKKLGP